MLLEPRLVFPIQNQQSEKQTRYLATTWTLFSLTKQANYSGSNSLRVIVVVEYHDSSIHTRNALIIVLKFIKGNNSVEVKHSFIYLIKALNIGVMSALFLCEL